MQKKVFTKILTILVSAFGLFGCMVGPDFETPDAPNTSTYTEEPLPKETVAAEGSPGGEAQLFHLGEEIPEKWWELFQSPKLNALIEEGFEHNPDIRSAVETLWAAEEELSSLIGETMYPNAGLDIFGGREQLSAFESLEGTPGTVQSDFPRQILTMYNTNIAVSYVFDVFGGNRRAIEALRAQMDSQLYEVEATYLMLAGNIVTTAIMEASLREQIKATVELIKLETEQLELTQKQYQIGTVTQLDVLAQESALAQTAATLPPLEESLAQTRHALAILVGRYPGDKDLPDFDLNDLHLPKDIPVSLPSTLIRQRPDIREAEALLHQASAQIGVATANLLPTFPIVGSIGPLGDTLSGFFDNNNISWTWQQGLMQPIFEGGSLFAQHDMAIAEFKAALAQYESTVLTGLQNVADSLVALENDAKELKETADAEIAEKTAWKLTQQQHELGGATILDVMTAEAAYQEAFLARIQAQAARYADTAALFQSLGGGWWSEVDENAEG